MNEAWKALQNKVAGLRRALQNSFQQAMHHMFGVRRRVVDHERKLCHDDVVYVEVDC